MSSGLQKLPEEPSFRSFCSPARIDAGAAQPQPFDCQADANLLIPGYLRALAHEDSAFRLPSQPREEACVGRRSSLARVHVTPATSYGTTFASRCRIQELSTSKPLTTAGKTRMSYSSQFLTFLEGDVVDFQRVMA